MYPLHNSIVKLWIIWEGTEKFNLQHRKHVRAQTTTKQNKTNFILHDYKCHAAHLGSTNLDD